MIAIALTDSISYNKKKDLLCREGDRLIVKVNDSVCIVFGRGGYFPIRKDNLKFIDVTVKELIKTIEEVEQRYGDIGRKDVFPVDFVRGIIDINEIQEEFSEALKTAKISSKLKDQFNEM